MVGGWRLMPGIFGGSLITNGVVFDSPLLVNVLIGATNSIGPLAGALALRWLRPAKGLFTSFSGVVAFLLCTTLLSPAISAAGGTFAMALGGPPDFAQLYARWVSWWLTDSGGTLYLAPALLLWLDLEKQGEAHAAFVRSYVRRHDLAVWAWVALVSIVLFLTPPLHGTYVRAAFPFLLVVPLSWIALRMSLRSAYSLITLVAIVATAGTVAGVGPFQNPGLANPLQLVGTLIVLLAMNVLTIVALVSEREEAQNADKIKSMFLANTSHELRTPLNAIIGFSSMIDGEALGPVGNPEYANYGRLIHSSGQHLLALINGLLDISKIEAGRFTLREETVVLSEAVAEALHMVAGQADDKRVALALDGDSADIALLADRKALRQVVLNLVSNAIKFTPEGGSVRVRMARGARGEAVLCIADTGIGIAPDALERVFQPFERAGGADESKIEGTGLGLSICRGLVHLHGGDVVLHSAPGEGTVATVTLPASRVTAATAAPMQAPVFDLSHAS